MTSSPRCDGRRIPYAITGNFLGALPNAHERFSSATGRFRLKFKETVSAQRVTYTQTESRIRVRYATIIGRPFLRDRCPVCLCLYRLATIYQRCRQRQTGPRPRRHCVRWESSSPKERSTTARTFRPMSIVAKRSPISASAELLLASTENGSQSRFVHKSKVIHPHLPSVVSRSFRRPSNTITHRLIPAQPRPSSLSLNTLLVSCDRCSSTYGSIV